MKEAWCGEWYVVYGICAYSFFFFILQITGSKAPQLKKLAQWLLENPMFDVDPKWAELVKERGNLPHDLQKRLPPNERKKGPGRPPLLSSPPGQQSSVSQASSLASTLPFPSLASAGLSGLSAAGLSPSSLLSGLSLGGFDPKNNPLLLPFGGMPNMSALGSMSGLGNLGNMSLTNSLFANLAGLGLPSLAGMDGSELGSSGPGTSGTGKTKTRKPTDSERGHSSLKPTVSSSSSSIPSSALPFFFPNPGLLYTPLGLGGLNPFSMQPGSMSSAYDSLAQQCGLLNGSLGVSGTSTATLQSSSSRAGHKSGNSSRPATMTSSSSSSPSPSSTATNHRHQRATTRDALERQQQQQLQQLLLPHDSHLLESLSRATSMEATLRSEKRAREAERKEAADKRARDGERKESMENLSRNSVTDFSTRSEERPLKKFKEGERKESAESFARYFMPDTSARSEEWFSRKAKESEMKEALENLCKTSVEILARSTEEKFGKRTRDGADSGVKSSCSISPSDERPAKRTKEVEQKEVGEEKNSCPALGPDPNVDCGAVDIEALLTSSTVSKDGATVSVVTPSEEAVAPTENSTPPPVATEYNSVVTSELTEDKLQAAEGPGTEAVQQPSSSTQATPTLPLSSPPPPLPASLLQSSPPVPIMLPEVPEPEPESEPEPSSNGCRATRSGTGRRGRCTKRSKQAAAPSEEPETPVVERKVLRSSAGRAAAAAAARAAAAAAAAAAAKAEEEHENSENTKDSKTQESVDANCEAAPSEEKAET